jgi:hypothetical protein
LSTFPKICDRSPDILNFSGILSVFPGAYFICLWLLGPSSVAFAKDSLHAGFLYDQFSLTLDEGRRTEAVGPLFYDQHLGSEDTWALPPFFSQHTDPEVESHEIDFLYPLLTYESYGKEYRWQFCQLLSFAGGQDQDGDQTARFTMYPLYFQQRSTGTNGNYTALIPFYGHLEHRLFRDKIYFVMFPLYSQTQKRDVVTDNYLYPFFHLRHGHGMSGWQFWPLIGNEHKDLTTQTNGFGDVSPVGGYNKFFALWPFFFKSTFDNVKDAPPQAGSSRYQKNKNPSTRENEPETFLAVWPLYLQSRAPQRDSTSVLWPFFSWIDDRGRQYHEWQGPWPFVIFTRGEGKTTSRVWPIFSQSHNATLESDSYLWPVFTFKRTHSDPLDLQRTRVLFYLYENTVEKNTQTGSYKRRVDALPFFTYRRDFNGNRRLQILAPVEPAVPNNRGIERNWSPLWSLWISENNPQTGDKSQSLLWNLYRHESTPTSKKCSLLFGLFQYQSDAEMNRLRLFYLPVFKTHPKSGRLADL